MTDTERDPTRTEDVEEGAWRQRCEALLASVGASEPDDHPGRVNGKAQEGGVSEGRVIRSNDDMADEEIEAEAYLELGDDCLAGLVRGIAADYSEAIENVDDEWRAIVFGAGVDLLLALAIRVNADTVTKELTGVTYKGEDIGDWRVTLERTRGPTNPQET